MERYFDDHVYVADWIATIFMVRLPMGFERMNKKCRNEAPRDLRK